MNDSFARNWNRIVLSVALAIGSWLAMQLVHELGHVLAAKMTGGSVTNVALHPLSISRTDVQPNLRPLIVAWSGPIVGAAAPLLAWGVATVVGWKHAFALRFFAGFCLIANGAYLAGGALAGIGDCGDIVRHGSPIWLLYLFGATTAPLGLLLWNGLAKDFGWGGNAAPVSARLTWTAAGICIALVAVGIFVGN